MAASSSDPDPVIRRIVRDRDCDIVRGLFKRAADYVRLESGHDPDTGTLDNFFNGYPPGGNPEESLRLGIFLPALVPVDDGLAGIAELAFDYPKPRDAFLGLMLLDPAVRGRGVGTRFLAAIIDAARARNALRIFVAVLDANPRGRAFWEREGFRFVLTVPPAPGADPPHLRHRMERRLSPPPAGSGDARG